MSRKTIKKTTALVCSCLLTFSATANAMEGGRGTPSLSKGKKVSCPPNQEYRLQKSWGCYDIPITPQPDKRCGLDFIEAFTDQQNCIRLGDQSACLASALSGASLGAGLGVALAKSLRNLDVPPQILERYKKVRQGIFASRSSYVRWNAIAEKFEVEALERAYQENTGKKPAKTLAEHRSYITDGNLHYRLRLQSEIEEALKAKGKPGIDIEALVTEKLRPIVEKNLKAVPEAELRKFLMSPEFTYELHPDSRMIAFKKLFSRQSRTLLETEFKQELEKFEQLEKDLNEKAKQEIKKVFPDMEYNPDSDPLYSKQYRKMSPQQQKEVNSIYDRVFNNHFKAFKPYYLIAGLRSVQLYSIAIHPQTMPIERFNSARHTGRFGRKSDWIGGSVGAVGGAFAMEGLRNLAENQLQLCSRPLNLSSAELRIIELHTREPKLRECATVRLNDPSEALLNAQAEFGFVPKGICELAQREAKATAASFARAGEPNFENCGSVQSTNFKVLTTDKEPEQFSCTPPASDKTFIFPITDEKVIFDPGQMKIRSNSGLPVDQTADPYMNYLKEFNKGTSQPKAVIVHTTHSYESSFRSGSPDAKFDDLFGVCKQQAIAFEAARSIQRIVCPLIPSATEPPSDDKKTITAD